MPTYEYLCGKCKNKFEVYMTFAEKDSNKKPECPLCKSQDVIQVFGNIGVMSKFSGGSSIPPMCGPQAGGGCCG